MKLKYLNSLLLSSIFLSAPNITAEFNEDYSKYGIFEKSAPNPKETKAVQTRLPLKLKKGAHINLIGNTLFDRDNQFGYFETYLQQIHPGLELRVRNLAWSADEVNLQPRPDEFGTTLQHLTVQKTDVIFAAFGYNESFKGQTGLDAFRTNLKEFIYTLKTHAFNEKNAPQIILLSPTANENISGVNAASLNNDNIKLYTEAMAEVASEQKIGFVDVFEATNQLMQDESTDITFNGVHMDDAGYKTFAETIIKEVFKTTLPKINEKMRELVIDKNEQWFYRYRPLNTFYYTGGRNKSYGYLDFLPAMKNFDIMVDNRERAIRDLAMGKEYQLTAIDSNVPEMPNTPNSRGANEWLSPADELKAFEIDPRFEVNLFASEEEFPEIACPIQMRWDTKGRMWVACSTTYPHVYPGNQPNDKIVILEDTNGDGKADKSTLFADDVHIPLSFEFGNGGIYVSEEPHLTFLKDTDGDGKADYRRKLYTGFGTEDSHHALHDFVWSPDGDLLFRESVFHNSQVETPYGPIRAKNSAWFKYRPSNHKLTTFGNYPNTNPWGVTYDNWGNHVASHPVFASAFHAVSPAYPTQHPRPYGINAYSGTAGHEFIDFDFWPKEMQGGFVKARYKPTNQIEIHTWTENDDHYAEKKVTELIFSKNLSFIPVDIRFGPRGAMYVCDWYNPIKGHAQYALRDERRDRTSGRIWRIVPKGAKLQTPVKIHGSSISDLLELLKRKEYRIRYWAKHELRTHDKNKVEKALNQFVKNLEPTDPLFRHHQVEAIWMYRNIDRVNTNLLLEVLNCDTHQARAAATRQLRYWHSHLAQLQSELKKRINDKNGLVRMEAVIAASYIGDHASFVTSLDVIKHPREHHLDYAIATSLKSETLGSYWQNNTEVQEKYPQINKFYEDVQSKQALMQKAATVSKKNKKFDRMKGLAKVSISCIPERMMFTKTEFTVKKGQAVKLSFTNPDVTKHNLVIVKPGAVQEIGMQSNKMAADRDGEAKHFIPENDKILYNTKLIAEHGSETLRFYAPKKPGKYPFLCTYPGHWVIMQGVMIVE